MVLSNIRSIRAGLLGIPGTTNNITASTSGVITWETVSDATTYKIYSSQDNDYYILKTTLAENLGASDTTVKVSDSSVIDLNDFIKINNEICQVTNIDGGTNELTLLRGLKGTQQPNLHSSGDSVYLDPFELLQSGIAGLTYTDPGYTYTTFYKVSAVAADGTEGESSDPQATIDVNKYRRVWGRLIDDDGDGLTSATVTVTTSVATKEVTANRFMQIDTETITVDNSGHWEIWLRLSSELDNALYSFTLKDSEENTLDTKDNKTISGDIIHIKYEDL